MEPYSALFKDLAGNLRNVIRGEIQLVQAETKDTLSRSTHYASSVIVGAIISVVSLLPLLAFLVIGVGKLLNENYWLSSLIVGIFSLAVGGSMALLAVRKIKNSDVSLPRTRESIQREARMVQRIQEQRRKSA